MQGSGCANCPIINCDAVYRGSRCKAYRYYHGLGDPQTNADKIRSMTDQELAVFLSRDLKQPCDYCQLEDLEGACTETLCDDAMMKWLQQPADNPKEV